MAAAQPGADPERRKAFPWCASATQLLLGYKRARENDGNRLPPFAAKLVRQAREESEQQVQRAVDIQNNPHADLGLPAFQAAVECHLEAAQHNRRCLRAYACARREALCDAFWQVGQNIPQRTMDNLSEEEEVFFRGYSRLCTRYMEEIGVGPLGAYAHAPPRVTDVVLVRGLKDHRFISAATGQETVITRGNMVCLTEEEAAPLLQSGVVQVQTQAVSR
eukprot:TRINITY_DN7220_c0_g1_i1.p1 TRINITY_DN7220_c0_g1~~TRINITY_DN7220_c0_g1_i1.p1  ORF type:complete len:245 (+),score=77.70 TRINITY_DN7220_c0_g1_i1:78-737(+)